MKEFHNSAVVKRLGILGCEVGTEDLIDVIWALRIRNVRERLATAANFFTSIAIGMLLLNAAIMLSMLLVTATFWLIQWTRLGQMHNIQAADTKSMLACCGMCKWRSARLH